MERQDTNLGTGVRHALFEMAPYGRAPAVGKRKLSVTCKGSMPEKSLVDLFTMQDGTWVGKENRFYSIASVRSSFFEARGRKGKTSGEDFSFQEWIAFDIDKVDIGIWSLDNFMSFIEEVMPTDGQRMYVWTGNGIQMLFRVPIFSDPVSFNTLRYAYKAKCKEIEAVLVKNQVGYEIVDPTAWDSARMFRLPNTINQKWNDDGSAREPKKAYLIGVFGNGPNNKLWDWLQDYKIPEGALQDNAKTGEVVDKMLSLFNPETTVEYTAYYKVPCPFHKDGKEGDPSLVIYRDGLYAMDFHETENKRSVHLFKVWMAVKYSNENREGQESNPRYREFCQFVGLEPPAAPISGIIREWLEEKFLPLYRDVGERGFYSLAQRRVVELTESTRQGDDLIYDAIRDKSRESRTSGKDGKESKCDHSQAISLYQKAAPSVFTAVYDQLPTLTEIDPKELPTRAKEDILVMFRSAFNQSVPHTSDGRNFRTSLFQLAKEAPWEDDTWYKAEQYAFFYRRFEGAYEVAFQFQVLTDLSATKRWTNQFRLDKEFIQLMEQLGICIKDRIFFGQSKQRVLKFTQEALDVIDFGQNIEMIAGSNRISTFMNDTPETLLSEDTDGRV